MEPVPGETSTATKVMYPEIPDPLTAADLHRLFTPLYAERTWASKVARTAASQLVLLVQLKVFQTIGRFRRQEGIPRSVIGHIAERLGVEHGTRLDYPDRTRYRHRAEVIKFLGISPWGDAARLLVQSTMMRIAAARTDPADLINGAIDALIVGRFELPALDTLMRLAATAHSSVNAAQWDEVYGRLSETQRSALESMLIVEENTQNSSFADLCRAPGRASRKNLRLLIERYAWLQQLPDPTAALHGVVDAKVLQWANEARRLKAPELREYIAARRQTLLLAVIRQARGQVLDDLTRMLLRLVRKIEWKSEQRLERWYADRRDETESLIRVFYDSLVVYGTEDKPADKVIRLDSLFTTRGGRDQLEQACAEHLASREAELAPLRSLGFEPLRSALLRLAGILPLQATATTRDLLSFVSAAVG
jgi:hypothetical protein